MKRVCGFVTWMACASVACGAIAACEGLGRPIVDHVPHVPLGPPPEPECVPASCADSPLDTLSDMTVTELRELDASACPASERRQSELLEDPTTLDRATRSCAELQVELPSVPGECALAITALDVSHVSLTIRASAACSMSLSGLRAFATRIRLEGPIALRIDRESRLTDVGISGVATQMGEPSLTLDAMSAERTAIGDAAQPFEGVVSARDTYLRDSSVTASDGRLETTLFDRTALDLARLTTVDAFFERSVIDVGDAVISASRLETSELRSCDSLVLVESSVISSVLRGCGTRPYRIFESLVEDSVVEGVIESDSTRFQRARFGLHVATDLVMFSGGVSQSAFCEHADRYRFGASAGVSCSSCIAGSVFEQRGVCALPDADRGDDGPVHCEAFVLEEPCAAPLPARMRDRHRP